MSATPVHSNGNDKDLMKSTENQNSSDCTVTTNDSKQKFLSSYNHIMIVYKRILPNHKRSNNQQ